MPALTSETINKVAGAVHTYDSFARSIVDYCLRTAAEKVDKKENLSANGQKVSFNVQVTVEDSAPCMWICIPGAGCFKVCILE